MKNILLTLALILSTSAMGQERPWSPPDRDLWDAMTRALDDVPMSKGAHVAVDQILQSVQTEAQMRAMRVKPADRPVGPSPKQE